MDICGYLPLLFTLGPSLNAGTQASDNAYACPTFDIFGRVFDTPLLLARDSARFGVVRVIVSDNTCRPIIHNLLYATNELSGAYLGGVLRVLEHPPSASSPVLLGTSLLLRGVRHYLGLASYYAACAALSSRSGCRESGARRVIGLGTRLYLGPEDQLLACSTAVLPQYFLTQLVLATC